MTMRTQPTARQIRLGAELRKLREAAGLTAREVAGLLGTNSTHMSQMEAGTSGISEERLRRLASNCACANEELIGALTTMATDRTRGWWEKYRGVLPQVFLDVAEAEHHATFLHEVVITHVPGLLQTSDYARAVFRYSLPALPESELEPRIEHRMKRREVLAKPGLRAYDTIVHEAALRILVADRCTARTQLRAVLDEIEQRRATVRVIPMDREGFAGASIQMMLVGGPIAQMDTVLQDAPHGTAFIDAQAQLAKFRALLRKLEQAALSPAATRDFIHRLSKEM